MNVTCYKCGKDSGVEDAGRFGINAAYVQKVGFISKMLTLYTGNGDDMFIACSKECAKQLSDEIMAAAGVTEERRCQVDDMLAESKKKIPEMARRTVEAVTAFQAALNDLVGKSKKTDS